MTPETILNFIGQNLYILVAALICVGLALKAIPNVPNWTIPFALGLLGILGAAWVLGGFTSSAVLQGVLCAAAAVFLHQTVKQGAEGLRGKLEKLVAAAIDKLTMTVDADALGAAIVSQGTQTLGSILEQKNQAEPTDHTEDGEPETPENELTPAEREELVKTAQG